MASDIDYFVSHATADKAMAVWIAWYIEENLGHKVKIDVWDFKPGQFFPIEMHNALRDARKVIAVLSQNYLSAEFTGSEWAAAFASGKLLPIKIESMDKSVLGLFEPIIHIDLAGSTSKDELERRLKAGLDASEDGVRNKPAAEPLLPFLFTAATETVRQQSQETQTSRIKMKCARFEDEPEFKAGLVDKDEQARHIFDRTGDSFFTAQGIPPLAFLLHGTDSQWPYALLFILYYQIKKQISIRNTASVEPLSPEPVQLSGKVYKSAASPENYLWELLAEKLVCAPTRVEIGRALSNKHAPHLLYRKLTEAESQNQELVCGMLEAWESLEFAHNTPRHMLVLYYEQTDRPQSIWFFWQKKGDTLIDKIHRFLPEQSCMKIRTAGNQITQQAINP